MRSRHKDSIHWKQARRVFIFVLACLVCLNSAATTSGFIATQQQRGVRPNTLVDKVHAPHWNISYSYADDCPAEARNNDAALTEAITEVLQMWLQPLHEYSKKPIVSDFRYVLDADRDASDLTVIFHCKDPRVSSADTSRVKSPQIDMRKGTKVTRNLIAAFVHEMGHAFGLADTYITAAKWGDPQLDKGGLDSTKGTQPASRMSGALWKGDVNNPALGRDDKNGVIWLYKVVHEGLSIRDCFFSDYELENPPLGCVPKRPLIFELKHGIEVRVLRMLEQDENLDLNARDVDGMTALHHAVIEGYTRVVAALLAADTIQVNIFNNARRTPAQLARELKHLPLAELIEAHPTAKLPPWSVVPKGKLATTWGHLKKRY